MSALTASQWHILSLCLFPVVDALGILLSTLVSKSKNRLWLACGVIFSAGVLLSGALVHMLPHATVALNERWNSNNHGDESTHLHDEEEYPTTDEIDDHAGHDHTMRLRQLEAYYQQREFHYQRLLQEHESHQHGFPWAYTLFAMAFLFLLCVEAIMERFIDVTFRGKRGNFFHDRAPCEEDDEVAAVLGDWQRQRSQPQRHTNKNSARPPKSIKCTHVHHHHNDNDNHHTHSHSHGDIQDGHEHEHHHHHHEEDQACGHRHDDHSFDTTNHNNPMVHVVDDMGHNHKHVSTNNEVDIDHIIHHDHQHQHHDHSSNSNNNHEKNINASTAESTTVPHSEACESCEQEEEEEDAQLEQQRPNTNTTAAGGATFLEQVRKIHEQTIVTTESTDGNNNNKKEEDPCCVCDCDVETGQPTTTKLPRRPSFSGSAMSAGSTALSKRTERRQKAHWAVTAPRPMVVQYHVGSSAMEELADDFKSEPGAAADARSLGSSMPAGDAMDELISALPKEEYQQTINPWVSILLTLVLSIHVVLEGLSLGSSQNAETIQAIFIAVVIHKGFASFSLGSSLIAAGYGKAGNRRWFLLLAGIFVGMDVVGLGVGMALGHLFSDESIVPSILQCLLGGSFLFVSTIELIPGELEKMRAFSLPVFPILFSLCLGFAGMTILGNWT